jgi:hypothetical protein
MCKKINIINLGFQMKNLLLIMVLVLCGAINLFAQIQSDSSDNVWAIVKPEAEARIVDMGEVLVGDTEDKLIDDFIKSIGSYPCRIDSVVINNGDADQFLAFSNLPTKVGEGDKKDHPVEFRFMPKKVGKLSSTIFVYTQADTLDYEIKGVGVKRNLAVFSDLINFGVVEVTDFKDTSRVLLTNTSTEDIEITKTEIFGPDKEQFGFVNFDGSVPFTLEAGKTKTITLRFAPKYAGRTSSQVAFYYNDNGVERKELAQLYGAGIGGSVAVTSDSAYAGETRIFKLNFGGVKIEKFAELVDSYSGVLRVEKTLLAPTDASKLYKITDDSTYIEFSGNLDPSNTQSPKSK